MKNTILALALIAGIGGCDLGEQASTSIEPLSATFQMTDTSGRQTTNFRSGEDFEMGFTVSNTARKTLTYHVGSSGPVVIFQILQGDSVVATSVDGYAFLMVVVTGHIQPGQSLGERWRGPNTPARNPQIVLDPGPYTVRASFVGFDEVEIEPVSPIAFSIVQ